MNFLTFINNTPLINDFYPRDITSSKCHFGTVSEDTVTKPFFEICSKLEIT